MKPTLPIFLSALFALNSCVSEDSSGRFSDKSKASQSLVGPAPANAQEAYRTLAEYWAPQIFQDTDSSNYKGDYITHFNFDGDYNGKNNWESLEARATVPAYVYYMVSETQTHYFIGYFDFHPQDWHEILAADRHENDLEGILLAVKKDGSPYGGLVAMETQAHGHQYQYAYAAGIASGSDNIDGSVTLFGSHPRIFVEAKGHGVYACDSRCTSAPGGDGIVYNFGGVADSPSNAGGNWVSQYNYELIAMDADGSRDGNQGFWFRRNDICDTCTFGSWGRIRGDNYNTNSAQMPWIWDDGDDGETYSGDHACDPAKMFDIHLNGAPFSSGFSHTYVNHIYATHYFQVIQARSDANRDPFGGASDIYVKVTAAGSAAGSDTVLDDEHFKKNSASVGTWYDFSYGGFNASGQTQYGDVSNSHYVCRQGTPNFTFAVYDSDSDGDDFMGSVGLTNSADYSAGIDLGDSRLKFNFIRY